MCFLIRLDECQCKELTTSSYNVGYYETYNTTTCQCLHLVSARHILSLISLGAITSFELEYCRSMPIRVAKGYVVCFSAPLYPIARQHHASLVDISFFHVVKLSFLNIIFHRHSFRFEKMAHIFGSNHENQGLNRTNFQIVQKVPSLAGATGNSR